MLIASPWEHAGPTDTFTRRSKLRCGISEGPHHVHWQLSLHQHKDWEREVQSAARSSTLALWAKRGSTCPGQCPIIRCTSKSHHPSTEQSVPEPARGQVGSPHGAAGFCVCYSNCERMIWVRGRHYYYSPGLKSVFFQWPSYCPSQSFFFGKMTFLG